MKPVSSLPLIQRAASYDQRIAIIDAGGPHTYRALCRASLQAASMLLENRSDLNEARVAFMIPPGFDYAAVQWGIWRAGGIAVPLCVTYPPPELEYVITDADADIIVAHPEFAAILEPLANKHNRRFIRLPEIFSSTEAALPTINLDRRAMILFTSGTTGKPKGVVTTHRNTMAQIASLVEAWQWRSDDHILHILPLHHVHGIINKLLCPLWSGAVCEMLPRFDAEAVWERFIHSDLTLFMAVPTIYVKLIAAWEKAAPDARKQMSAACPKMRLMVSGSAALPVSVFEKWQEISGHTLLERYGMTEIGIGISNPLHGERRPGYIGTPLPGVFSRLIDDTGKEITDDGVPGEIRIKGENVFLEYWRRPAETQASFQGDWFRTGDTAVIERGYYRILGRQSVDIIKTGGYKVSALEIEEVLRTHAAIRECAVVGIEDPQWGERVCAAVVLKTDSRLDLADLRQWAREKIADYKIPGRLLVLEEFPRNAMGKVTKPALKRMFTKD